MDRADLLRRPAARRAGRILFLIAAFVLLATVTPPGPAPPPAGPAEAPLIVEPVPLDRDDPRRRVGHLVFLGGWALTSTDPRFGGISALHVEAGQATAISDAGVLLRFRLPGGAGDGQVRIEPLPRGPGRPERKRDRDSEAMAVAGDRAWVAFEMHNMIWRYRRPEWRAEAAARPRAMAGWGRNSGPEGLVRLRDGRFLALAEGRDDGGAFSAALLFDGDPVQPGTGAARLRYRRLPGFRATDAAQLPDGRLIVLNRRFGLFSGFEAALTIAPAAALRPGGTIEGRVLAELRAPLAVDNMEALSVTVEQGRTIVWIASDDNFSPLQRTLLLKFELAE